MQSVSWIAFGSSNALSHTVVHFFPSSGTVSAPYPARCKFRLFGQGETGKAVTIEGPRLSHPDGVRLDQVFPSLSDGVQGFLGMEVSLVAVQPRVDLSPSLCMIELSSRAVSAKFRPVRLLSSEATNGVRASVLPKAGIVMQDVYAKGSLVAVNGTGSAVDIPIRIIRDCSEPGGKGTPPNGKDNSFMQTIRQGAYTVSEIPVSMEGGGIGGSKVCSWGNSQLSQVELANDLPPGTALYSLHRDVSTNLPVSVNAL